MIKQFLTCPGVDELSPDEVLLLARLLYIYIYIYIVLNDWFKLAKQNSIKNFELQLLLIPNHCFGRVF